MYHFEEPHKSLRAQLGLKLAQESSRTVKLTAMLRTLTMIIIDGIGHERNQCHISHLLLTNLVYLQVVVSRVTIGIFSEHSFLFSTMPKDCKP